MSIIIPLFQYFMTFLLQAKHFLALYGFRIIFFPQDKHARPALADRGVSRPSRVTALAVGYAGQALLASRDGSAMSPFSLVRYVHEKARTIYRLLCLCFDL